MTSLFLSSSSTMMIIPVLLLLLSLLLAADIRSVDGAATSLNNHHQPAFILSLQSIPTRISPRSTKIIPSRVITTTSTVSNKDDMTTQLYAGSGFGSKSSSSSSSSSKPATTKSNNKPKELFELQELSAQLETIKKQNILLQNLSKEKSEELSNYVKAVVDKTDSPIDVKTSFGTAKFVAQVENKSWRMIFSTDSSSSTDGIDKSKGDVSPGELPYGSTVILRIGEFMGTDGSLDYVLKFSKRVLGLNELVAKSSCSVDIGPVNPGVFTFTYEDIKTNIFGVSNLPVGFFGLLKGRVNYIDTVWFDGERWIERNYLENGDLIYSVYVRDTDDEKEYKK